MTKIPSWDNASLSEATAIFQAKSRGQPDCPVCSCGTERSVRKVWFWIDQETASRRDSDWSSDGLLIRSLFSLGLPPPPPSTRVDADHDPAAHLPDQRVRGQWLTFSWNQCLSRSQLFKINYEYMMLRCYNFTNHTFDQPFARKDWWGVCTRRHWTFAQRIWCPCWSFDSRGTGMHSNLQ